MAVCHDAGSGTLLIEGSTGMGAHNFIVFGKGKTAREAFDALVREAE